MLFTRLVELQDAPYDLLEGKFSCLREDSEQLDLPNVGRVNQKAVFAITSAKISSPGLINLQRVPQLNC